MEIINIVDNTLGTVLIVEKAFLEDQKGNLVLLVNPMNAQVLPCDDINETVSNAFIYIVTKFIEKNNIDFKPNGDFDSKYSKQLHTVPLWEFRIYGNSIDPMEYFIDQLKDSK
jgi:hypothetical protein